MPNEPQDIGDIFAEEEARLRAEHEAWLADPEEQAKVLARALELAAREALLTDEPEQDDEDDEDDDEDDE